MLMFSQDLVYILHAASLTSMEKDKYANETPSSQLESQNSLLFELRNVVTFLLIFNQWQLKPGHGKI